jgi:hypothetical protein
MEASSNLHTPLKHHNTSPLGNVAYDSGLHKANGTRKSIAAYTSAVTCRLDSPLPRMCVFEQVTQRLRSLTSRQVIVEQVKFYHQDLGILYQILLVLSTQILGYSLAGLTRRYLVRPSGMIWPATLVSTAMFTALHQEVNKPANGWTISPRKFFGRVFMGGVVFYFLPGLLFPALSSFNVITWFAPRSVIVANLVRSASSVNLYVY